MRKRTTSLFVIVIIISLIYISNELSHSRKFQFFGGLVTNINTDLKVVALTFDDGPGPNTNEVLEIMRNHDVKGTFYLSGYEIERNIFDAKKIVNDGHEIGNHTYSHKRMIFKSPSFIKYELEKTDELIRNIEYGGDISFRPPNGRRLILLPYILSKQNRSTVLWNIEPESYAEVATDADKIVDYVVKNIEPGSIILLHVMYESRRQSLNAVEGIISSLKEEGYSFLTVTELLEQKIIKKLYLF
ncbi:polysaccharide deacetylase family protein [Serpentinicella alkaliphila]|uniref:Chitin deacetylase n=1 Tax=Serpentinicella alkaliphila TaxID=1734049 RepID=A0A4R2T2R4_9FIRM|nr:polysaccharide deacetylase family protein [Serpentinicella alkaliphila]QUH26506.1 polysaccharide deacetylase family protein [Serpentinicella alkaliphila]TCP95496.1 chitin deacetylase [Serpentinicella alkaliphila]